MECKAYCSTANLGPGFDTFGLALDKYFDLVRVRKTDKRRIRIILKGPLGKGLPTNLDRNSAGPPTSAMLQMAEARGGLSIEVEKNVPVGQGLGSSGATAAACVKAVDKILELNLSDEKLVDLASLGEAAVAGTPHTDNVAASILGGFAVTFGKHPLRAFSIRPPRNLVVAVVTPRIRLPARKTRFSRGLIPKTISVGKAVLNIGRASAIVAGLCQENIPLAGSGMLDEIAEPYRMKLIPGYTAVREAALSAGASGVGISGAGPSVVALVDDTRYSPVKIGEVMIREFRRYRIKATWFASKAGPPATVVRKK